MPGSACSRPCSTLERWQPHADLRAVESLARMASRPPRAVRLGRRRSSGGTPNFSNPDFVVPNVHQFSAGVQRQLPWDMSLDMTYAGSRSTTRKAGSPGYNEPSAAFQRQCDVTLGGSRSVLRRAAAQPVPPGAGLRGHRRFTSPTLSRFELNRPFPAFTGHHPERSATTTKLTYDSPQFVLNKRFVKGVTVNASYTWCHGGRRRAGPETMLNRTPMRTRSRVS